MNRKEKIRFSAETDVILPLKVTAVYTDTMLNEELKHRNLLLRLTSSKAVFSFGDTDITLHEGDVMYISSDAEYSCSLCDDTVFDCITFEFGIPEAKNALFLSSEHAEFHSVQVRAEKLIAEISSVCSDSRSGAERASALLYQLMTECSISLSSADVTEYSSRQHLIPLTDYINSHIGEQFPLERMCSLAGNISRSSLFRYFSSAYGITPSEYVNRARIESAKAYLTGTNLPISEIYPLSGYNSAAYFGKVFSSLTGLTPTQYRKLYTKKED